MLGMVVSCFVFKGYLTACQTLGRKLNSRIIVFMIDSSHTCLSGISRVNHDSNGNSYHNLLQSKGLYLRVDVLAGNKQNILCKSIS